MTEEKKTFGEWARRAREATPYSLRHVAEAIGVSPQQLSNAETGYTKVEGGQPTRLDYDKIIKLAEFYGKSPAEGLELAGYYVHHPKLSRKAVSVGEVVDQLPATEQDSVLAYAEMRLKGVKADQGGNSGVRKSGIKTSTPKASKNNAAGNKDARRRVS